MRGWPAWSPRDEVPFRALVRASSKENRHKAEGRELAAGEEVENLVLEFRPRPTQDMLIACLWSKWTGTGEADLLLLSRTLSDHLSFTLFCGAR